MTRMKTTNYFTNMITNLPHLNIVINN